MPSILDLPIEKQRNLAKTLGMSLSELQEDVRKGLAELEELLNKTNDSSNPRILTGEAGRLMKERYESEADGIKAIPLDDL